MVQQSSEIQFAYRNQWDTGRFVTQGGDASDVRRTLERITGWEEDWCREWCATAAMHEGLAREAEAQGHTLTAGEAYLRAGVYYHWAKFRMAENPDQQMEALAKSVAAYWKGLQYVDPTAQRVEIPFESITMAGHLRRPQGADRPPLVLLLGGADAVKEELYDVENHLLKRGLATLSVDGPGQGETRAKAPARHDFEKPISAILDFIEKRADVDSGRVGVVGLSRLGAYYAVRGACVDHRIKACVSVSGPSKQYKGGADNWSQYIFWVDTPEESAALMAQYSLEGLLSNIGCPLLIVHGEKDQPAFIPESEEVVQEIRAAGGEAEMVVCEEGTHVCNNVPYRYKPLVSDWMADRLVGGRA